MADEFVFDFCDEAYEGIHVSVSTDPPGGRDVRLKSLPSTSSISTSNIPVQTTRERGFAASKYTNSQLCIECRLRTPTLKKHVLRYHIAKACWFAYPLRACWTCKKFETKPHAKSHGPYSENHHHEYASLVLKLFADLRSKLDVSTNKQLLSMVHSERWGTGAAVFMEEELEVMDGYDRLQGLPPLRRRNLFKPSRLSTLLHWKLLQRLLMCAAQKKPSSPVTISVPTDQASSLVVSVASRKVTFYGESSAGTHHDKSSSSTRPRDEVGCSRKPSTVSTSSFPSSSKASKPAYKPARKPASTVSTVRKSLASTVSTVQKGSSTVSTVKGKSSSAESLSDVGFYDSHCHLDRLFTKAKFHGSLEEFLRNHDTRGFLGCISNFCDLNMLGDDDWKELWAKIIESPKVFITVGLHPKSAESYQPEILQEIKVMLTYPKVRALGEMGLDYSTKDVDQIKQRIMFKDLLRLAVEYGKPVVIHCREAHDDCLHILKRYLPSNWKIHFHCFTEGWSVARQWLSAFPNAYIGLTPMITWRQARKSRGAIEIARKIPLKRLLLETDAPYFTPSGRSGYCVPTMAKTVAQEVAHLQGVHLKEVFQICRRNTREMYSLPE